MGEGHEARVAAALAVRSAVVLQLNDPDPHHLDLDAWGETLDAIIGRLAELAQAMSVQVRLAATRRLLSDDEGADPAARAAAAAAQLAEVHRGLRVAREAALDFRAELAHVGVEVDPHAPRRSFNEWNHEVMPFWPGLMAEPDDDDA